MGYVLACQCCHCSVAMDVRAWQEKGHGSTGRRAKRIWNMGEEEGGWLFESQGLRV